MTTSRRNQPAPHPLLGPYSPRQERDREYNHIRLEAPWLERRRRALEMEPPAPEEARLARLLVQRVEEMELTRALMIWLIFRAG